MRIEYPCIVRVSCEKKTLKNAKGAIYQEKSLRRLRLLRYFLPIFLIFFISVNQFNQAIIRVLPRQRHKQLGQFFG
jgi:hypothetical protein